MPGPHMHVPRTLTRGTVDLFSWYGLIFPLVQTAVIYIIIFSSVFVFPYCCNNLLDNII